MALALRPGACPGDDNGALWAGTAPTEGVNETGSMSPKNRASSPEGALQAGGSSAARTASRDDSHVTQASQEKGEGLPAQPPSSKGVSPGTLLRDQADIAFVCCLLERQQVQDIQRSAQAQVEGQKASSQREVSTIDWDAPLQTTRVLDCDSTEDCRVQHAAFHGSEAGPRLGHRLFERIRPGELRLATTLISEQ